MGTAAALRIDRTWDGRRARPDEIARLEIEPRGGHLVLRVDAPFHGDPPPASPPGSTEGLWEHEAVEAFLLGRDGEYLEIELGPHGHYLVLRFRGPRKAVARGIPLGYEARIEGDRWRGTAAIPFERLPAGIDRVNAYAVHGSGPGRRHLAAFPVPGDRPDFHRPEAFGPFDAAHGGAGGPLDGARPSGPESAIPRGGVPPRGGQPMIQEIRASRLDPRRFTEERIAEIRAAVGDGTAINALSGGVDSSVVTMLGHLALGRRLRTVFVENGLMREGEARRVRALFRKLGVAVEVVEARDEFFAALRGIADPEEKREAITRTFYREVFGRIVRESGARHLLQGTILTDVDETVAGIKRQHNVFEQLGIDPQEAFGYRILEPLIRLRKDGVRKLGRALGLPAEVFSRIPFPGPALAARVIGEATPERIETVRKATAIVERALSGRRAFQYLAILHQDRVTGMRGGRRDFGLQIEIRCWDSTDARRATPTRLPFAALEKLAAEILRKVPGVVSVTYNVAPKPPSTIEAV